MTGERKLRTISSKARKPSKTKMPPQLKSAGASPTEPIEQPSASQVAASSSESVFVAEPAQRLVWCSKASVIEELQNLSGQLTDRSRFLSAAVIAAAWAILNGKTVHHPIMILICVAGSVVVIACDFLQYLTQYHLFDSLEKSARHSKQAYVRLDSGSALYRARWFFFGAKVRLTVLLAAFFCATIAWESFGVAFGHAPAAVAAPEPGQSPLNPLPSTLKRAPTTPVGSSMGTAGLPSRNVPAPLSQRQ